MSVKTVGTQGKHNHMEASKHMPLFAISKNGILNQGYQ